MISSALIRLTKSPIRPETYRKTLEDPGSGGVALFEGRVRDDPGHHATRLYYEAYSPLALRELERLSRQAANRFGARRIVIVHRLGHLRTGEIAVFIGVATAHRAKAFAACRFLIDELKRRVPIWKTREESRTKR